jgi:hypothetical protein
VKNTKNIEELGAMLGKVRKGYQRRKDLLPAGYHQVLNQQEIKGARKGGHCLVQQ